MNKSGENASALNRAHYDLLDSKKEFVNISPHLKHKTLKDLYLCLVNKCVSVVTSKNNTSTPRVLDLGSGDGEATLSFLSSDCAVTAVDISIEQLNRFNEYYPQYKSRCTIVCSDVIEFIENSNEQFDIIVLNSFLHHVPDYISLLNKVADSTKASVIFIFQDPIYYQSLNKFSRLFSKIAYLSWRITQGDILNGIKRRLARNTGDFSDPLNSIEYHVVRDGVNQDEIATTLVHLGYLVSYIPYFSTQSVVFQWLGDKFGVENTFAIIATYDASEFS